jgi:hypothetical protein
MKKYCFIALLLALFGSACKSDSSRVEVSSVRERNPDESASESTFSSHEENVKSDRKTKQSEDIFSSQELEKRFPRKLGSYTVEHTDHESSGAFGFHISSAQAEYGEGKESIRLEMIDFGGIPALAKLLASWSKSDIHHEDKDGFERVTEWKGHKAFEKSDTRNKESSLAFLYKDRMLVTAKGEGMSLDDLKEIIADDLMDRLRDLAID